MNYGRYQIVSELGHGAMGMVYQAHDPQIDRLVALKVLREDRLTTQDYVQRFLKEATAIGRLSHAGIVTVYDVGQDHGTIYIAMEFLEGQPLDQLAAGRKMPLADVVRIGAQVARALHYAHDRGIVHRDIKPPNIIITNEGTAKVTDFGIAHIDDPDGQQMTRAGEILGTPVYMAPEQVMGQPVDGRSDLYSLGVILYELTTGQRPFKGENLAAVFRAITQDTPLPPEQLNPDIPPALARLIVQSMAKEPADRFATGRELAELIDHCLDSPDHTEEISRPPARRRFVPVILAGVLVILLIGTGLVGYQYLRQSVPKVAPPPTDFTPQQDRAKTTEQPQTSKAQQHTPEPSRTANQRIDSTASRHNVLPEPDTAQPDKKSPENTAVNRLQEEEAAQSIDELFSGDGQGEKITGSAQPDTASEKTEQKENNVSSEAAQKSEDTVITPPLPSDAQMRNQTVAQPATLQVKSRPGGAKLYLDGEYKGTTPIELHTAAEKHEVKLELLGHLDWQAQLDLSKGGKIPLSVRLLSK